MMANSGPSEAMKLSVDGIDPGNDVAATACSRSSAAILRASGEVST